tara:strand:- start:1204 stop:1932 length:729 start_codon:yes stop_codon:yes gene_type:complete
MVKILKVRDPADGFCKSHFLFDLPFRILLCSKSQLGIGKTTIILGLLLDPNFKYHDKFEGENIYIVSNNKLDNKLRLLMEYKEIPSANYMKYDEQVLENLYDELEEEFLLEKEDKKIINRIIIFDDVGYSNSLRDKSAGIVSKLICNGRHLNISQIYSIQKMSQASPTLRANITAALIGSTSMKELQIISENYNYLNSNKQFIKMFRDVTKKPRSFLCVNFTNKDGLYMNSEFQTIDTTQYE